MGDTMSQDTCAWGLMPICDYLAVVEESFTRDYQPRFGALSISIAT